MFAKKELYFCSLMRLAVIPLCMVGLFYLCGVRGDLLIAMVISASAPHGYQYGDVCGQVRQ